MKVLAVLNGEDQQASQIPSADATNGAPFPVTQGPSDEELAQISHDGRWIAYQSNESGRTEIYVQLSLGHATILTTERYLGVRQDLNDAPCDHLGLNVQGE